MRRPIRPCAVLVCLLSVALAPSARADNGSASRPSQPPPDLHRLVYRDLSVFRLNPLGLITDARLSYRLRLYESDSAALQDNFVSVGIAPVLSGAFARVGPVVEIQPLTILNFWASFEYVQHFGLFNVMQSFATVPLYNPDDPKNDGYSDTALREYNGLPAGDARKNYATGGTQLNVGANFQIKFGPVAVRSQARFNRPSYDLRGDDKLFYDIVFDALVPNDGWYFNNDADLLWVMDNGLSFGLRHTVTHAFLEAAHFEDGAIDPALNPTMHRAGPLVAYSHKAWASRGYAPTFLAVANWWLSHRYRTGRDSSQLMPYLVLGFAVTGDLLPAPK